MLAHLSGEPAPKLSAKQDIVLTVRLVAQLAEQVSTTWSRRRPKRHRRSQPANLSVAKTFEHVEKVSQSCIRTRVRREQDRLVTLLFRY